jgi:hypothetical protein
MSDFPAPGPVSPFECDLDPASRNPRVRLNFANGYGVSLVIRTEMHDGVKAQTASIAVMRGRNVHNVIPPIHEAFPEEVAEFIAKVVKL